MPSKPDALRKVLDWKPPRAKWFVGGRSNASVNWVDRRPAGPRRKAAIVWEGEPEPGRPSRLRRPCRR
jgi:acetyl-CoA synthetase